MYEEILKEAERLEQRAKSEGYRSKYRRYIEEYNEKFCVTEMTELEKHILIFLKFLDNHHFLEILKEEGDVHGAIAFITVRDILLKYTRKL